MNGAQALVEALVAHGVDTVFGVPGDTSMPLYDALFRERRLTHIMARDERTAGFMADAYARVSGRPGVVEGPSGAGATYVLPALAEATDSSLALVAINSDIRLSSDGTLALTELDQLSLFRPVTKWNCRVIDATRIPSLLSRAFSEATSGRPGAVHLAVPENVLTEDAGEFDLPSSRSRFPARRYRPDPAVIEDAARQLAAGSRPLILAGGGVITSGATEALVRLAEIVGAPVATSINGKGAIVDSHPLSVGVVGGNGGKPSSNQALAAADVVLAVGTRMNSVTTDGGRLLDPEGKIIWVDISPARVGHSHPGALAMAGDARLAIDDLTDALGRMPGRDRGWAAGARARVQDEQARARAGGESDAVPVEMLRLVAALERTLPAEAIIVADAGTATPYLSAYYPTRVAGRSFIFPRAHGGLGYALAGALGARLAEPDRPVVALFGDGSLGMSMGELETLARVGEPVVLVNLRNDTYGWIKIIQDIYYDRRYFSVDFSPADYAAAAAALGVEARAVESARDLERDLEWALSQDGPAFLDVPVESLVCRTPPVTRWQADRELPAERRRRGSY